MGMVQDILLDKEQSMSMTSSVGQMDLLEKFSGGSVFTHLLLQICINHVYQENTSKQVKIYREDKI